VDVVASLQDTVALYQVARRVGLEACAAHGFAWVRARLPFDIGVMITTSNHDATWIDAHFFGVADPHGLMEGHARVRHLDDIARQMVANPGRVYQHDLDAPELAGERLAPLREHLARFAGQTILGIAVPLNDGETLSVLAIGRDSLARRFSESERAHFEAVASHVVEAAAVNRTVCLSRDAGSPADALPVAILGCGGWLLHTTPAFVRLMCPGGAAPHMAFLPQPILRALQKGRSWPLPDGRHSLHGHPDDAGGYLLRVRTSGPVDKLSARERQIATLFARGVSYKGIAGELSLAPTTVRNHLQTIYTKLGVGTRDELITMLQRP
jgi:DNA-binding CsgD family transcriptional regulator